MQPRMDTEDGAVAESLPEVQQSLLEQEPQGEEMNLTIDDYVIMGYLASHPGTAEQLLYKNTQYGKKTRKAFRAELDSLKRENLVSEFEKAYTLTKRGQEYYAGWRRAVADADRKPKIPGSSFE